MRCHLSEPSGKMCCFETERPGGLSYWSFYISSSVAKAENLQEAMERSNLKYPECPLAFLLMEHNPKIS